jgi:hypothetical protein
MDHLFDRIASDEEEIRNLMQTAQCRITLKLDGTPMQLVRENGKTRFCKKGESGPGKSLSRLDIFLNPAYYEPLSVLHKNGKKAADILEYVHIVNFEVLVPNTHHVIHYNTYPKGHMCLLNIETTSNGRGNMEFCRELARRLGADTVPVIFEGVIGDKTDEIIELVKAHCDPHNPVDSDTPFTATFTDKFGQEGPSSIPLLDTESGEAEGFVLTFLTKEGGKSYKIDTPYFIENFRKSKEERVDPSTARDIAAVVDAFISAVRDNGYTFTPMHGDQFENLIMNFRATFGGNRSLIDALAVQCSRKGILQDCSAQMAPSEYRGDRNMLTVFRTFCWLFSKKRKSEGMKGLNKYVGQMTGQN